MDYELATLFYLHFPCTQYKKILKNRDYLITE